MRQVKRPSTRLMWAALTTAGLSFIAPLCLGADSMELPTKSILRAEPEMVLWTVDGDTRVGRDTLTLPAQRWEGDELRPRLSEESQPVTQVRTAGAERIEVDLAGNESEGFQLVVTPTKRALQVDGLSISDLKGDGGTIPANQITINVVGYVWGFDYARTVDGRPTKLGPFPDVLLPVDAEQTAAPLTNYTIYVTVHAPAGTRPGDYNGDLSLHVDGKAIEPVPVRAHVWDFELPRENHVDNQLFSIDEESLCVWYGLSPWQPRTQELRRKILDTMADHRLSPAYTPAIKAVDWRTFPVQSDGKVGPGMKFDKNKQLPLAGPHFEDLADGFTVACWLRTDSKSLGDFLRQYRANWNRWNAGYRLMLQDGQLIGEIGVKAEAEPPRDPSADYQVHADYPGDGQWHYVAFSYSPSELDLFIDGKPAGRKAIDRPMEPGWSTAMVAGSGFTVDELRWAKGVLTPEQVAAEMDASTPRHATLRDYDFGGADFDFASRVDADPQASAQKNLLAWAGWCKERGLWLNGLTRPAGMSLQDFDRLYCQPLRDRGELNKAYFRLPHDEASYGPQSDDNRVVARQIHKAIPDLLLNQTLGGMGGSANPSWQDRLGDLRAYVGDVDIWVMRSNILDHFWGSFFQPRLAAGDHVTPYAHEINNVEDPTNLVATRLFPWHLFQHGLNTFALWNVNLWFQPYQLGGHHEAKHFWITDWGFCTTKRNPSIVSGMLFYPGKDGPLGSLQLEAWRDGIEDYECLLMLKQRLAAAEQRGEDVAAARAVLARAETVKASSWLTGAMADTGWVHDVRRQVSLTIERLGHGQ